MRTSKPTDPPRCKVVNDVEDTGDMSELDLNRSTALDLADRETHLIGDIDEALSRIEDGTYGHWSQKH